MVEVQVNDPLFSMHLHSPILEDNVPNHSIVCRSRKALNKSRAMVASQHETHQAWHTSQAQSNYRMSR